MYSTERAWSAKLMSITDGGWPSAAARLMRRPSPRRLILRPSRKEYSSTNSRVVLFDKHVLVAGDGAENVAQLRGFGHGHHTEAVHRGFERFGRINFRDNDFGSSAAGPAGQAASAPSVPGDYELRSSEQE